MSLQFTLSQMELFALSEQRYYDAYFRTRSFAGIKPGVFWGPGDLMAFHREGASLYGEDDYSDLRAGVTLDELQLYACVHIRWDTLKIALKAMREGELRVSEVRKVRADFIACLSQVQW